MQVINLHARKENIFFLIYHFVALTWPQGKKQGFVSTWEANLHPLGLMLLLKKNNNNKLMKFAP
jgi:hypothetical protein